MNVRDLEPISEDLRALLSAESERPGMPDAARARLANKLGLPTPGGGGSPDQGGQGSEEGGTTLLTAAAEAGSGLRA